MPADPYAAAATAGVPAAPSAVPGAPFDPYASGTAPVMAGGSRTPDGTWQPDPEALRVAAEAKAKAAKRSRIMGLVTLIVLVAIAAGIGGGVWYTNRYKTPLTQAQFNNLINQQMPVDFGGPDFYSTVSMSDIWYDETDGSCAAYEAFDGRDQDQMQSAAAFDSALGSWRFLMANFTARSDAEDIAKATNACLGQIGVTSITENATTKNGVGMWAFTGVGPDAESYTFDIAIFHNIMAYAEDVDQAQWATFVSTTFPQAVNAARK
jgi:hypothetical protein